MSRSGHVRVFSLTAATVLFAGAGISAHITPRSFAKSPLLPQAAVSPQTQSTVVTLRWGARAGVSRYRLQLAKDPGFTDIVFDRVVNGNVYDVTDLPAGRYFWRIAPLTGTLGEFSSAGVVEAAKTGDEKTQEPAGSVIGSIITARGWLALIGDVQYPVLAHLRSRSSFEIVGVNADRVTYALDGMTGVALWSAPAVPTRGPVTASVAPLLIQSAGGLDDVIIISGQSIRRFNGATGHELWRGMLPVLASGAAVLSDNRSPAVFILDSSLRGLLILNANDGRIAAKTQLPNRVIGAPVGLDYRGSRSIMLAYENGRVEIRDQSGRVVRAGDSASGNTTAPLFVTGPHGGLILVGTKNGLTALNADDLRPLGRVTLQNDAPRGTLTSADLDSDGYAEAIMLTDRGGVVAVHAADGKIIWQSVAVNDPQGLASADINRDGVVDILVAGRQGFAFALSGRDGSLLWKQDEQPPLVANHAAASGPHSVVAVPMNSGMLLVASDASGLRAIELHTAARLR